jgi:bacterial/archaeal transporter family protein
MLAVQILTNLWIELGTILLIVTLILYMGVITRLDLSYVLPMSASNYTIAAIFAWLLLHEAIPATRWIGTLIISTGILIVGLGEQFSKSGLGKTCKLSNGWSLTCLVMMGVAFAILPQGLIVAMMVMGESAGDLLLATGIRKLEPVKKITPKLLPSLIQQVLTQPQIGLGIMGFAVAFFLLIHLLSSHNLSLIMPLTALNYPLILLGSHYFLKEQVTIARLAGTGLVCLGAALISFHSTAL